MQIPFFSVMSHPGSCGPLEVRGRLKYLRLLALCTSFVLSACSTVATGTPQEQVNQRATERWKLLLAKKFEAVYAYTTPGFRALVDSETYRNRFGASGTWVDAQVVRVDCPEPVKCRVIVRLDVKSFSGASFGDKFSSHLDEVWLLESGQWYIFQEVRS